MTSLTETFSQYNFRMKKKKIMSKKRILHLVEFVYLSQPFTAMVGDVTIVNIRLRRR